VPTAYEFTDWVFTPRSGFVQPFNRADLREKPRSPLTSTLDNTMHRLIKIVGYAGAVVASFMLFRLAAALGVAGLLLVISFAFVGAGNRLAWIAVLPVVAAAIAAVAYAIFAILPEDNERLKLLVAFVGMPVAPGLILWAAVRFRKFRTERQQEPEIPQQVTPEEGVV
jgi:hypothetical protein